MAISLDDGLNGLRADAVAALKIHASYPDDAASVEQALTLYHAERLRWSETGNYHASKLVESVREAVHRQAGQRTLSGLGSGPIDFSRRA